MDLLLIALLIGAVVMLMRSMRPHQAVGGRPAKRQLPGAEHNKELAERRWAAVRRIAEEDVTQLGQQIAATPVTDSLEPEAAQDFDDALNAYERAKEALEVSTHPDDLQWVTRSIDDGRFALAKLEARRTGRELPNRRPPCFFDQRHGLSVADAQWAPPEGALRDVPVCAACDARIKDGLDPQARMVETAQGQRPYYDAGPEYAPYMRGWYAASGLYMMNNILLGTMLLNAMYFPPGYDYFGGEGGEGADGGDAGDAGDAGGDAGGDMGGDMGGGDFGGGDFGGFGDFGF
ncbi:MAG: hypothetical protein MUD13_05665 [Candidatus Nanopelagicales bacterium]|nr:hypothetical protein [Candidatus Nanopelagicales bacterium]